MLAGPATDPNQFAQDLFTGIPDRYDMLEELLSLGQNRRWRRAMVDRIVPAAPARVLDVASGTAGVALQLADRTDLRVAPCGGGWCLEDLPDSADPPLVAAPWAQTTALAP